MYSHSYNYDFGVLEPNNWLILPEQTLAADKQYVLTFMVAPSNPEYLDNYGIFISTNDGETSG